MSNPLPDKAAWKVEATRVASLNCRAFHAFIDFSDDVPDLRSPAPTGIGTEQATCFLKALFRQGEKVVVATAINSAKIFEAHAFRIKKPNLPKGGWFRVNRMVVPEPTGRQGGVTDKDVACDHLMLEMDDADRPSQLLFWAAAIHAGMPVVALTDSGKKSFHAIIRINAGDVADYKAEATRIMELLLPMLPDNSTKNPSSLSRIPGVIRDETQREQELLYLNPSAPVWSWDNPVVAQLQAFAPSATPIPETVLKGRRVSSALREKPDTEEGGALDKAWTKRLDSLLHRRRFDLHRFAEESGWVLFSAEPVAGLEDKHFITCPWSDTHSGGGDDDTRTDAYIYQRTGEARFRWGFHCSHDSCQGHKILDVLELAQAEDEDLFKSCIEADREVEAEFGDIPDAPEEYNDLVGDIPDAPAKAKATVPESLLLANPNDMDNLEIFRRMYADRARYFHNEKEWALWDGQRWKRDETEGVVRMAMAAAQLRVKTAGDDIDAATKAKASGTNKAITATLNLAKASEPFATSSADFDQDDYLVGCVNGVLNLMTGELLPATPGMKITRQLSVAFDPLAKCPRWERFLEELFPYTDGKDIHEIPGFLQRWFGYSLSGNTRLDIILILHGAKGRNGKSTMVKVLSRLFADYGAVLKEGFLSGKKFAASTDGPSPSMLGLLGKRLAFVNETGENVALDEAKVKMLTGGDDITARGMYSRKESTFPLTTKLVVSTNHAPVINGTDDAIWSRIRRVDFNETFLGREDLTLESVLMEELPGILAWCVRGHKAFRENGIQTPKAVQETTSDYKNSEDRLLMFLQDHCVTDLAADEIKTSPHRTTRKDLYAVYARWARENHVVPQWSTQRFCKKMEEKGFGTIIIHGERIWTGVSCAAAVDSI